MIYGVSWLLIGGAKSTSRCLIGCRPQRFSHKATAIYVKISLDTRVLASVVMSNIVKDAGKKEERSKIACSITKVEDEAHSTVHTPSMKWEEE